MVPKVARGTERVNDDYSEVNAYMYEKINDINNDWPAADPFSYNNIKWLQTISLLCPMCIRQHVVNMD